MSKIFTNKKIWKMLVVAFLTIMAFQFVVPTTNIFAAEPEKERTEDSVQGSGGTLATPIASLVASLGDGILQLMHRFIMGQEINTIITVSDVDDNSVISKGLNLARKAGAAVTGFVGGAVGFVAGDNPVSSTLEWLTDKLMPNEIALPVFTYSPEEIFKGKILLFNVNFFDDRKKEILKQENENGDIEYYYYADPDGEVLSNGVTGYKTSQTDSVFVLKGVISEWYVVIRNICIVGMLSVLVYIGIKMILTSVASDKAKYKEMLKDWIVGLCLLFVVHYIMAFSNVLVEKLTDIISSTKGAQEVVSVPLRDDYNGKLKETTDDLGLGDEYWKDDNGEKILYYPTNLMGRIRLEMQLQDNDGGQSLGLTFCYIALVVETFIFTYKYIVRVLYMAFLTLIAPFVGLTYCIDKVKDGQAQGFNKWLKEYIFNLLIQPLHLLLYFVLVGSVSDLRQNVIYSIVALVFMIPAEKLLRGLFGFENAKTPPSLLGTGAALSMASAAFNRIKGGESRSKNSTGNNNRLRTGNNQETSGNDDLGGNNDETRTIADAVHDDGSEEVQGENDGERDNPRQQRLMEAYEQYGDANETPEEFDERTGGMFTTDAQREELRQQRLMEAYEQYGDANETPEEFNERTGGMFTTDAESSEDRPAATHEEHENTQQEQEAPTQPIRLVSKEKNSIRDKFIRTGRTVGSGLRHTAITGAKTLGKTAVKGTVAVGGAMIAGAATAATTGDVGKTVQAMAAGAATGSAIADRGMRSSYNLASNTMNSINELREEINGGDTKYKEKQQNKQVEQMMKDVNLQNELSKELGEDELKSMKDSGELETYLRNGATDSKDIVALRNLREHIQQEQGISSNAAIDATTGVFKINRDMAGGKDTTTMTNRDKLSKALNEKFEREVGADRSEKLRDKTMGWLDVYNKKRFH